MPQAEEHLIKATGNAVGKRLVPPRPRVVHIQPKVETERAQRRQVPVARRESQGLVLARPRVIGRERIRSVQTAQGVRVTIRRRRPQRLVAMLPCVGRPQPVQVFQHEHDFNMAAACGQSQSLTPDTTRVTRPESEVAARRSASASRERASVTPRDSVAWRKRSASTWPLEAALRKASLSFALASCALRPNPLTRQFRTSTRPCAHASRNASFMFALAAAGARQYSSRRQSSTGTWPLRAASRNASLSSVRASLGLRPKSVRRHRSTSTWPFAAACFNASFPRARAAASPSPNSPRGATRNCPQLVRRDSQAENLFEACAAHAHGRAERQGVAARCRDHGHPRLPATTLDGGELEPSRVPTGRLIAALRSTLLAQNAQ
eukprot:6177819-Pleurochrysis_carterae.AAC.3